MYVSADWPCCGCWLSALGASVPYNKTTPPPHPARVRSPLPAKFQLDPLYTNTHVYSRVVRLICEQPYQIICPMSNYISKQEEPSLVCEAARFGWGCCDSCDCCDCDCYGGKTMSNPSKSSTPGRLTPHRFLLFIIDIVTINTGLTTFAWCRFWIMLVISSVTSGVGIPIVGCYTDSHEN